MSFVWGLVIVLALSLSAPAAEQPAVVPHRTDATGKVIMKMDKDGTRVVIKGNKKLACDDGGMCVHVQFEIGAD